MDLATRQVFSIVNSRTSLNNYVVGIPSPHDCDDFLYFEDLYLLFTGKLKAY